MYSQRPRAAGRRQATVVGFLAVLALLLAVNFLSYGLMHQADIAGLSGPVDGGPDEQQVGGWAPDSSRSV